MLELVDPDLLALIGSAAGVAERRRVAGRASLRPRAALAPGIAVATDRAAFEALGAGMAAAGAGGDRRGALPVVRLVPGGLRSSSEAGNRFEPLIVTLRQGGQARRPPAAPAPRLGPFADRNRLRRALPAIYRRAACARRAEERGRAASRRRLPPAEMRRPASSEGARRQRARAAPRRAERDPQQRGRRALRRPPALPRLQGLSRDGQRQDAQEHAQCAKPPRRAAARSRTACSATRRRSPRLSSARMRGASAGLRRRASPRARSATRPSAPSHEPSRKAGTDRGMTRSDGDEPDCSTTSRSPTNGASSSTAATTLTSRPGRQNSKRRARESFTSKR